MLRNGGKMTTFFSKQNKLGLIVGLIFILGALAYANTWNTPFQFDDRGHILQNPNIREISKAWHASQNSRLLPNLSAAFNFFLGKTNVIGYHLFNFGVHALNALWVYFLISLLLITPKMLGKYSEKTVYFLATFSALVFLVHPLQIQAVTYIIQRMTSMAAFFYLGAVVFYLKGRLDEKWSYNVAGILMAIAAMYCKENAFTLPLAIVLVEALFFGFAGGKRKAFLRLHP